MFKMDAALVDKLKNSCPKDHQIIKAMHTAKRYSGLTKFAPLLAMVAYWCEILIWLRPSNGFVQIFCYGMGIFVTYLNWFVVRTYWILEAHREHPFHERRFSSLFCRICEAQKAKDPEPEPDQKCQHKPRGYACGDEPYMYKDGEWYCRSCAYLCFGGTR